MPGEVGALGVNSPKPQSVSGSRRPRGEGSALPPELFPKHLCRLLQLISHVLQPLHILLLVGSEMGWSGQTTSGVAHECGHVCSHNGSQQ